MKNKLKAMYIVSIIALIFIYLYNIAYIIIKGPNLFNSIMAWVTCIIFVISNFVSYKIVQTTRRISLTRLCICRKMCLDIKQKLKELSITDTAIHNQVEFLIDTLETDTDLYNYIKTEDKGESND